jgi:hypothetical protein
MGYRQKKKGVCDIEKGRGEIEKTIFIGGFSAGSNS